MLRGEQVLCGTTTTGTGTLTLAATPGPPGGVDFDVIARATGVGFANSATILVPYNITEYTNSAFTTAKSMEKGWGTLTLGGSSGIANCTLARTTVQVTATNLNSPPATYNTNAPAAFSIGTAANTLVFIGISAADIPAYSPYFEASFGSGVGMSFSSVASNANTITTLNDYYCLIHVDVPMLVKKASARVGAVAATGTTNAYARMYAVGTNGRPGKLLIDFGVLGTGGSSLNTASTTISSAVHSTGYFLTPGYYFTDFLPSFSAGSPTMVVIDVPWNGRCGISSAFSTHYGFKATSGTAGAAPDPANVTSISALIPSAAPAALVFNTS